MATPDPQLLAEPLLDANEAARLLRVPRSTLYELVRSRGVPHIRIGRALRFTRGGLAGWICENTYGNDPASGYGLSYPTTSNEQR